MSDSDQLSHDLECRHVTKSFGDFIAVKDVSFTVPKGSFFSILGPSGCGKTTIMRMIAGFLDTSSGDILIKGRSVLDVAPNRRPVNMVFQHLALFPMMDVAGNIGYGLRRRGLPGPEIAKKVGAVLERVGLPDAGPKNINQLSGGQKQRVAIARCMVLDPDVLLLDEPLGALDLKLRDHMKVELKKLQSQFDTTFVYITHDQSEALVMSDQIAVMNKGEFEQVGTAHQLYYDPATAFVAGFVGDSNRWRGKIQTRNAKGAKVSATDGLAILAGPISQPLSKGDDVDIFVRPESIVISFDAKGVGKFDNNLQGTVEAVLFNGANSRTLVRETATGTQVDVALPQTGEFAELTPGTEVHLGWGRAQARCFAASDDVGVI